MGKIYIGVDPGSDGYLAIIAGDGYRFMPIGGTSPGVIGEFLSEYRGKSCMAIVEDVHAVFGSSAMGTFNFGFSKGFLLGLLIAHKIPYVLVSPKNWQGVVWINGDKEYIVQKQRFQGGERKVRKVNTKATSINAARRLFPDVDLRKSSRAIKPHDGKADALLMAEYGRRLNL